MGGKGGGGNVDYASSPEQQQLLQYIFPIAQMLGMYSEHMAMTPEGQFRPHLGAPMMGNAPVAAPKMPAGPGMYQIPSTKNLLPTQDWWNNLSPEIKAGLYAPYEKSADILQERLGGLGQLGSARPGGSGAPGAAIGEFIRRLQRMYRYLLFNCHYNPDTWRSSALP